MKIEFPKTDLIGCKFLGFDGRKEEYLDTPWQCIPKETELRDRKQYTYRCIPGLAEQLSVGDMVVVSCKTGFQVCVVTEKDVTVPDSALGRLAYAITKVDVQGYFDMVQREQERKRMRVAIEAKRAELEKSAIYEMLAQKDPQFAALLEAYRDLGGTLS